MMVNPLHKILPKDILYFTHYSKIWAVFCESKIRIHYIDGLIQDVTPLLTHWSQVSLALTHRYLCDCHDVCSILLTHLPRAKMAAISQTICSNAFSWMKLFEFQINFLSKIFLGTYLTIWVLVQIMAWCRIGNRPLSEPMPTQFTDAYMWH